MKIEFQNSIVRLSFLCCIKDTKIAINSLVISKNKKKATQ